MTKVKYRQFFLRILFAFSISLAILFLLGPKIGPPVSAEATAEVIPETVYEHTRTIEVRFSGLPSAPYDLCLGSVTDKDKCVTVKDGDPVTGFNVAGLCADKDWALKQDCGGDEYFQLGNYTVSVTEPGKNTAVISLTIRAYRTYPEYEITSDSGGKVSIYIDGPIRPGGSSRNNYIVEKTGGPGPDWDSCLDADNTNELNLIDEPGDYRLEIWEEVNESHSWCGAPNSHGFRYYLINLTYHRDGTITIDSSVKNPGGDDVLPGEDPDKDVINTQFADEPGEVTEVQTPFGIIQATPQGLARAVLSISISTAGGIAFLLMVFGAYRLMFAGGNPESIQQGREVITAAIAGLLIIIFAVFVLRFVGINIFQITIPTT